MPRVLEISALVRLAGEAIPPETLARAIRVRWPDATEEDVREALTRVACKPPGAEERLAMVLAATALLRR